MTFVFYSILWVFAIYGLIEIIKSVYYIFSCTNLSSDGIYIIIVTKNQENKIENFVRTTLFRLIYGKEEQIKNIIFVDLNSTDDTKIILENLQSEYGNIKILNWKKCKEIIDNIEEN